MLMLLEEYAFVLMLMFSEVEKELAKATKLFNIVKYPIFLGDLSQSLGSEEKCLLPQRHPQHLIKTLP